MSKTEFESRMSTDREITRACLLQAKWNGTTPEEEYEKTMAYKGSRKFNPGDVGADKQVYESRELEQHERTACKYFNTHVLGKFNPCGEECRLDCPNCKILI